MDLIGDVIAADLPELQTHAESMMRDSCTIKRATGETTRDPVTLEDVPVFEVVYAGKCRVQRPGASVGGSEPVVGEREFGVQAVHFQLPLSALGVKRGDVAECDGVDPSTDPDLLGVTATVKANLTKTHATKRTLVCEEVTP
jgi:hypothetical protein